MVKRKKQEQERKQIKIKIFEGIAKSVSNIADILKDQYGLKKRKHHMIGRKEADKRKLKESGLRKF